MKTKKNVFFTEQKKINEILDSKAMQTILGGKGGESTDKDSIDRPESTSAEN